MKQRFFVVVKKISKDAKYNYFSPGRGLLLSGPFHILAEAEISKGDGEIYELRKTKYIVFDTIFGEIKIKEDWICEYPLPRPPDKKF